MANTKISALSAASVAAVANELPVNEAGTTKKVTLTQVVTLLETLGKPIVRTVVNIHTLNSATATELTELQATLVAGNYIFQYYLMCSSSATGTGVKFGINYTGTVTRMAQTMRYVSTGGAAATGIADGTISTLTGNIYEGSSSISETTTSPNLGPHTGVASADELYLVVVEGVVVVSDAGDLEIWHGSEGAVNTSVHVGSSAIIIRTA